MMRRAIAYLVPAALALLGASRTLKTIRDLSARRYPAFVRADVGSEGLGIPVFTYHSVAGPSTPDAVTPTEFERHMRYLSENGYHTLTADELYDHLVHGQRVPRRSVVITFDDGRATLWTLAYPILKRYHLKAVAFLLPGAMRGEGIRPNLEDYRRGLRIPFAALRDADLGQRPTVTWDEVCVMHESGLIDLQSHTMNHIRTYDAPMVVDFMHPGSALGYLNCELPVIRYGNIDRVGERLPLGTPIYRSQSRMGPALRFLDDEDLRRACVDYVAERGGPAFFERRRWRAELGQFVADYRREHTLNEGFESPAKREAAIRASLVESKAQIERRLPGHVVRHLCYPWHRYSALAICLAREAGYLSTFLDINPQKLSSEDLHDPYRVQRVLPINEFGDDPYQITRIGVISGENVVLSLPGRGRLTYPQRVMARLLRPPRVIQRLRHENSHPE